MRRIENFHDMKSKQSEKLLLRKVRMSSSRRRRSLK
jgi:hypothetical protein